MPAAMLVLRLSSRHGAVPGCRQEHRFLRLISFCPRGRKLKSLILAFVAPGESPPCSYCQLPDRDQSRVTTCLAAALQSSLGRVLLSWGCGFSLSRHWALGSAARPGWKPAITSPTLAACWHSACGPQTPQKHPTKRNQFSGDFQENACFSLGTHRPSSLPRAIRKPQRLRVKLSWCCKHALPKPLTVYNCRGQTLPRCPEPSREVQGEENGSGLFLRSSLVTQTGSLDGIIPFPTVRQCR